MSGSAMAVVGGLSPVLVGFHETCLPVRRTRSEVTISRNRAARGGRAEPGGARWICGAELGPSQRGGENGAVSRKKGLRRKEEEEELEREREESRRSIEGLEGDEFDAERAQEWSLDSIEGLAPGQGEWGEGTKFADFERKRDASLNSIEGLTEEEEEERKKREEEVEERKKKAAEEEARNAEWRNVFPAYMQSREDEEYRAEDFDAEAVARGRREAADRAGGRGEPGGAEEFRSGQFGHDPIWAAIRAEARLEAEREPLLSSFLYASILAHRCFERSIGFVLANRLKNATLLATQLLDVFDDVFMRDVGVQQAIRLDVQAVRDRDPACGSYSLALLYLKGYHALQAYRVAHALWNRGQRVLAHALQSRISEVLAVDIHPAARIGKAILLDHGTGVVIGETAVVGDRVSMLHGVTLGGTGKAAGDRHPKIREGVLIGAGATILGNIVVGKGAMVAAGSLVLKDVPPHSMVAGTPARVVNYLEESTPSLTMKQDAPKGFCKDVLESALDGGAGI